MSKTLTSRSPIAKAARRLVRNYLAAATMANASGIPAEERAAAKATVDRLEPKLADAFATIESCKVGRKAKAAPAAKAPAKKAPAKKSARKAPAKRAARKAPAKVAA